MLLQVLSEAIAAEMYDLSPDPKELHILPGSAHATDILGATHADEFRQILLNYLEGLRATTSPTFLWENR
jgi:hypothetical protein